MRTVLTIAGSDPSGGAGIQADLKVFHSFGVHGFSVITALTAQSTLGVKAVRPVDGSFIAKQISVLLSDVQPDAVKIGMIHDEAGVRAVADAVRRHSLKNVVFDPVVVSTSGRRLMREGAIPLVRRKLLPLCSIITPNMFEAAVLTGIPVRTVDDMKDAAALLSGLGVGRVIVTGGHLDDHATDVFWDGKAALLRGRRIAGEYHGTGCAFSSAIAACLAKGDPADAAARKAKAFVSRAMGRSFGAGGAMRLLGI